MIPFSKLLFKILPQRFHNLDSYRGKTGRGLLERFLESLGLEIDDYIIPKLENYLDIKDSKITDLKFLSLISNDLGSPPDIFDNESIYRNLLLYILSIYKIKGTRKAYEIFFKILGFGVIIEELYDNQDDFRYDSGNLYDSDNYMGIYDQACPLCSDYKIKFYSLTNFIEVSSETIQKLKSAIKFVEPINAKLIEMSYIVRLEDNVTISSSDSNIINTHLHNIYDSDQEYDTNKDYDD